MPEIQHAAELRTAHLAVFDNFGMSVTDLAEEMDINVRFARELLGVLQAHGFVAETEVNGEDLVWQTTNPGTYDSHSREDAEFVVDEWLGKKAEPAKPKKGARKVNGNKDTEGFAMCNCGCGERVTSAKAFYRPGHDARHAGQVGRAAAQTDDPFNDEHYADLTSDALVRKAKGIAENALAKAARGSRATATKEAEAEDANPAPVEGDYEVGTVTVGKNEFPARRARDNGTVERMNEKGEWEKVSKTATKTFQV